MLWWAGNTVAINQSGLVTAIAAAAAIHHHHHQQAVFIEHTIMGHYEPNAFTHWGPFCLSW